MNRITPPIIRGLTIIEMVICLAIIGIIFQLTIPNLNNIKYNQELNILHPIIKQLFAQAKVNALTFHSNVVMCSTKNFKECQDDNWSTGILLFVDKNQNRKIDSNEIILKKTPLDLKYGKLSWVGNAVHQKTITFQGDTGLPRGVLSSFNYCGTSSPHHLRIFISDMSHSRTETSTNFC